MNSLSMLSFKIGTLIGALFPVKCTFISSSLSMDKMIAATCKTRNTASSWRFWVYMIKFYEFFSTYQSM